MDDVWFSWIVVACPNCHAEYWVACRFQRMPDEVVATLDRIDLALCERWAVGHGQTVGQGTRPIHPAHLATRVFVSC